MGAVVTDDYALFFQLVNEAAGASLSLLALMILCLSRLLPMIALLPFFGAKVLPHPVKMGFGLCLFVILLPKLLLVTTTQIHFNANIVFLILKEAFIGIMMGLLASFPFWAAQIAGLFTDHQRGGASLMIQDPTIQSQSSPLGTLYNFVLIYLFFLMDGPFYFLDAVVTSYDAIPPDKFFGRMFFTDQTPIWEAVFRLFSKTLIMGVQLASPALLVILMTDMFLGIINRMAPQVMITFLGMPLKGLLALAVVMLGWKLLTQEMVDQAIKWMLELKSLVRSFGT